MLKYANLSDPELVTLLKKGDSDAFTTIYKRYWSLLMAISYSHLKDRFLAEEIAQEVFLSLWRRQSLLKIDTLNAYLATAVKYAIFKHLNQSERHRQLLGNNYNQATYVSSEDIDARFLQDYINGVVERLPEKCRIVYKMSRNLGLTIPEIATELKISEKTVQAHLSKALKVLRVFLKRYVIVGFLY